MRLGIGRSVGHEIVEIVFVQDHAVVFEPVSPFELRVDRHLFLIDRSVLHELMNARREIVRLFDVPFVEFEMHGERPVGNAVKAVEIIGSRFILSWHRFGVHRVTPKSGSCSSY